MTRDDKHPVHAAVASHAGFRMRPGTASAVAAAWFVTGPAALHTSLFLGIHDYLGKVAAGRPDRIGHAHALYREQVEVEELDALLSIARAARLVALIDDGLLTLTGCAHCGSRFVTLPAGKAAAGDRCGLCAPAGRRGNRHAGNGLTLH